MKDLSRHVTDAQDDVRAALRNWDAGDLSRIEECCGRLERAVPSLTAARQCARLVAAGKPAPDAAGAKQLRQIRDDIILMARLVDAASAFCRGMAMSIGAGEDLVAREFEVHA